MPLPSAPTSSPPVSGTSTKNDSVVDRSITPSPEGSEPQSMPRPMLEGPGLVLPPTANRPITRSSAKESAIAEKQASASTTFEHGYSYPLPPILPTSAVPSTPLFGQQSQLPTTSPSKASTVVLSEYGGPITAEQQKMIDHLMSMSQRDSTGSESTYTAAPALNQARSTSRHTFLISSVSPAAWEAEHRAFCNRDPLLQASGDEQVRGVRLAAHGSEVDRDVDDGRQRTSVRMKDGESTGETAERDGGESGSGKRRAE